MATLTQFPTLLCKIPKEGNTFIYFFVLPSFQAYSLCYDQGVLLEAHLQPFYLQCPVHPQAAGTIHILLDYLILLL